MYELATRYTESAYQGWDSPFTDDAPREDLYEYIVGPEPLADSRYDEGAGD